MKRKVLVIDKDPAIIDVITLILQGEGYDFKVSQKPFYVQEVKEYNPSLVLIHNGLNNEGSLICQIIKSCTDTRHIPIIMSSTRSDLAQVAENSCAEAYIHKPFDIDEFVEMIRNTIINS